MGARKVVAVTGAAGFVGKNLLLRLAELDRYEVRPLIRDMDDAAWRQAVARADAVIHLAGVNRPDDPVDFEGNIASAERLVAAIEASDRRVPVIYASTTKAIEDTPYGRSKKAAEDRLLAYAERGDAAVAIFRLPNLFGKWCRPNYNSAIATFCHNITRDLPITVCDPAAPLTLLYVDDLIDALLSRLDADSFDTGLHEAGPAYQSTVGEVAALIRGFHEDRKANRIDNVGVGLTRALYATYVSYLPTDRFSYELTLKGKDDPRGFFAEMLKTRQAGQFSYFTTNEGQTRGGHYHHTKTEKFLIVHGKALFRFRHMLTDETHEIRTSAAEPVVVETIPGWTHDVTNVGDGIMVSLLWANEVFDPDRPDTTWAEL